MNVQYYYYVVVGGGIAGVTCAETLAQLTGEESNTKILLVSESTLIKALVNHEQMGYTMESMDITEKSSDTLTSRFSNLSVIHSKVLEVNTDTKRVTITTGEQTFSYNKICIATGACPNRLSDNEHVLSIRDTQSVQSLQEKLEHAERIVVVGNGGIATELVYEVKSCQVVWCIRDKSISAAFFDDSAAQFFLPHLQESSSKQEQAITKRWKYTSAAASSKLPAASDYRGNALGPDWAGSLLLCGATKDSKSVEKVLMEYEVETDSILTPDMLSSQCETEATNSEKSWPVYIKLTNGKVYGADVIINATGVTPSCRIAFTGEHNMAIADDGGITIDMEMRSSLPDVYAAGDIVSTSKWNGTGYWYQRRLWSQAKQMGFYAAKCMYKHTSSPTTAAIEVSTTPPIDMDICFELFSHVTQFFGFKVVLLGLYNGQGLQTSDYTVHIRCTQGKEYIKVIVLDGCVVGAVLIGDTDMEETLENLILNRLDISQIEDHLLDPHIDIDDYFD